MESHFVKLEPPYQIIHYGGVVGIQIGTLIVVGENSFEPKGIDIRTRSHPVVSYVDKHQLKSKLGKDRGNYSGCARMDQQLFRLFVHKTRPGRYGQIRAGLVG